MPISSPQRIRERVEVEATGLDRKLELALERLTQAVRADRQARASANRLSPLQLEILDRLKDGEPNERKVAALARGLNVAAPTVSDATATLETKRLIKRRPDPGDGRSTLLELTAAGRKALDRATDGPVMADALAAVDTASKGATLRVVLEMIAAYHNAGTPAVWRMCTTCRHYRPSTNGRPGRCKALEIALPAAQLRLDCPAFEPETR